MTALAINRSQRRGACPGLSAPMPTGDGLLVRLLPIGTIPLAAFGQLCAAARREGNGVVEVTGRGSIQVRGLNAASARRFADAVAALGIAAEDGIPVLCNALAGLDGREILDANAFAADLRRALTRTSLTARLAAKVSIAIDGGGAVNFDNISSDVRLRAQATGVGTTLCVGIAGDDASATQIGVIEPAHGVDAAIRLLEVIARCGRPARSRDILAAEGGAPFRSALDDLLIEDETPSRKRTSGDPIGSHRLRDGSLACGVGLAFGHADATTLERLAEAAERRWRDRHTCSDGPRADDYRTYGNGGVRFRQCRRKSWLHCRSRRSTPAYRRLCRRADLFIGAHCRARTGAAGRWDRGVTSRWFAPGSHLRLRQGLRLRRQRAPHHCRFARRVRPDRQRFGARRCLRCGRD